MRLKSRLSSILDCLSSQKTHYPQPLKHGLKIPNPLCFSRRLSGASGERRLHRALSGLPGLTRCDSLGACTDGLLKEWSDNRTGRTTEVIPGCHGASPDTQGQKICPTCGFADLSSSRADR
jgi:hypothetical protein